MDLPQVFAGPCEWHDTICYHMVVAAGSNAHACAAMDFDSKAHDWPLLINSGVDESRCALQTVLGYRRPRLTVSFILKETSWYRIF